MEKYDGFLSSKQKGSKLLNKIYLEKNIFIINDFITEEEQAGILDGSWIDYREQIKSRISILFDNQFDVYGQGTVRKLVVGESTEAHSDQHETGCECGSCINNPDLYFFYGIVLYLNDNFTGGQLTYTKKDILYTPTARSLICHPASLEYEHRVLEVLSGERKFISFFLQQNIEDSSNKLFENQVDFE